jgi:hypothetical protein
VYDLKKRVEAFEREKDRVDKRMKGFADRLKRHMIYVILLLGGLALIVVKTWLK